MRNKRVIKTIIASAITLCAASCCNTPSAEEQQPYTAEWGSLQKHEAAPEWFKNDKIGFYFHWGVYS